MSAPFLPLALAVVLAAAPASRFELFDRLSDPETEPYRITGTGFVIDSSHPTHPGDFRRIEVEVRIGVDPELGESAIEVEWGASDQRRTDRWFVRRGRIFQVNEKGEEIAPAPLRDLSAATLAAIHPAIIATAIRERPENLRRVGEGAHVFAWNDEQWEVGIGRESGRVLTLRRRFASDVFGDGEEEVVFDHWPPEGSMTPGRVLVRARDRDLARLEFGPIARRATVAVPAGDRQRDRSLLVPARAIELREVAPHLYAIELDSLNMRVMVAEFADHVAVIEGAYSSRVCDRIAWKVQERLHKPVRWFAFSHLHGQYVGGTRSWVRQGATVLVPPSTAPLIEEIVKRPFDLRPDLQSRTPRRLQVETVKDKRRLEDGTNTLEIYNVESGHTDEYLIFYFPLQKVLLTGDLLFYREGQPLTGRSKQLCETVEKLGLDVVTYLPTWPLHGYGTKNVVTAEEVRAGCGEAAP